MKILKQYRVPFLIGAYFVLVYGSRLFLTYVPLSPILANSIFFGRHILFFLCSICYLYREDYQKDWEQFLQHFWKNMRQVILFYVILFIIILVASYLPLSKDTNSSQVANYFISDSMLEKIISIITVSIVGPINEELVFRKIMIGQGQHYFPKSVCLILSSILFGLIHIFNIQEFLSSLVYMFAGLFLGAVYINKKNILFSTGAHVLNNSFFSLIKSVFH